MTPLKSIDGATCLVTGGAGFVGKNLVTALLARGCDVRVLDRVACPIEDPRVTSIVGDLVDEADVRRALEGATVVFHTAAIIELSELAPPDLRTRVHSVNVEGTRRLLELAEATGVERFVQTSSTAVVLGPTSAGGDESLPYNDFPDLYCSTKVAAEKLVRAKNGAKLRTASLRPGGIYGPGERNQLVAPLFEMLRRGEPLTLLGDGTSRLDYTHIDNLVDAHLRAAERLVEGSPVCGAAYFVSDDQPINHGEMSRRLARAVGMLPRVRHLPARVAWSIAEVSERAHARFGKRPLLTRAQCRTCLYDYYFSIEAARRDLGYAPISTDEGIATCVRDIESLLRMPRGA